jgi:hypothetical protein
MTDIQQYHIIDVKTATRSAWLSGFCTALIVCAMAYIFYDIYKQDIRTIFFKESSLEIYPCDVPTYEGSKETIRMLCATKFHMR